MLSKLKLKGESIPPLIYTMLEILKFCSSLILGSTVKYKGILISDVAFSFLMF